MDPRSWDGWGEPGITARCLEPGLFEAVAGELPPGTYGDKFMVDGARWSDDPANPGKAADGFGGHNSVLEVTEG